MTKMEIDNLIDNLESDLRSPNKPSKGSALKSRSSKHQEIRKHQKSYYSEKSVVFPPNQNEIIKEDTPQNEVKVSSVPVKAKAKMFDKIVASSKSDSKSDSGLVETYERKSRPITRDNSRSNPMAIAKLRYRSTSSSSHRSPSNHYDNKVTYRRSESSPRRQEFFRHRDSRHGKPLPGVNQFIGSSWPNGLDQAGNRDSDEGIHYNRYPRPVYSPQPSSIGWSTPASSPEPPREMSPIKKVVVKRQEANPPSPLPDYMKNLRLMEINDPPYSHVIPPKFGTLTRRRYPNIAKDPSPHGPPCGLCYEPIDEDRCIVQEGVQYHVWHYACSYCLVTLKQNDFTIVKDNKPFCTNCYRRMLVPNN